MTNEEFSALIDTLKSQMDDVDDARTMQATAFVVMTTAIAQYNTAANEYNAAVAAYEQSKLTAIAAKTAYETTPTGSPALLVALQSLQDSVQAMEAKRTIRDNKWTAFETAEAAYNANVANVAALMAIAAAGVTSLLGALSLAPPPVNSRTIPTDDTGGARLGVSFSIADPR